MKQEQVVSFGLLSSKFRAAPDAPVFVEVTEKELSRCRRRGDRIIIPVSGAFLSNGAAYLVAA